MQIISNRSKQHFWSHPCRPYGCPAVRTGEKLSSVQLGPDGQQTISWVDRSAILRRNAGYRPMAVEAGGGGRGCLLCHIRGVFKKFAAQPRRKTNFRTQRGVRDVTLLKRPLTQPLANRSSCFAQAVGCCKNVCYFCRTQRRSAGSSDSIRSVTEKCHKGYPRILVGNTGGMLSSL